MKRKAVKMTAQFYGQFLMISQVLYTGTYLADHLGGLTHDNVHYFLKTQRWRGATSCLSARYSTSTTADALSWCAASTAAMLTA